MFLTHTPKKKKMIIVNVSIKVNDIAKSDLIHFLIKL